MKFFIKFSIFIILIFGFFSRIFDDGIFVKNFSKNFFENKYNEVLEKNFLKNKEQNSENILIEKNFKKSQIWKNLQNGDFNPIELLTFKKNFLNPSTYKNDESVGRFVDPKNSLTNRGYKPKDLVSLAGKNIDQAGRSSQIRQIAKKSLDELALNFQKNFGEPLIAISGYRSAEYQQRLWDLGRCDDGDFCAKPGFSEHQLGLAIDFFDATSETEYLTNERYKNFVIWMQKNAYKYGWTQSYKHGVEIDGYEIEPWHWRYIGNDLANILHILDMSYSKYLKFQKHIEKY